VIDEIQQTITAIPGVRDATGVRVRWLGHRLHAEVNVAVDAALSVQEGHEGAKEVRHQLLHQVRYLSDAIVHVDPANAAGEEHHHIVEHAHDGLPAHSHA